MLFHDLFIFRIAGSEPISHGLFIIRITGSELLLRQSPTSIQLYGRPNNMSMPVKFYFTASGHVVRKLTLSLFFTFQSPRRMPLTGVLGVSPDKHMRLAHGAFGLWHKCVACH